MSNNSTNTTYPLSVPTGGTGNTSLLPHGVLLGEGTAAIGSVPVGLSGQVLTGVTGADPVFGSLGSQSGLTAHSVVLSQGLGAFTALGNALNGQLIIGSTGSDPVLANLTAGLGVTITNAPGSITIACTSSGGIANLNGDSGSASGSTVTISGGHNITTSAAGSTLSVQVTGTTNHAVQIGNASGSLSSVVAGTNGQVLVGFTGADPIFGALGIDSGLTAHSLLLGQNTSAITALGVASNGQIPIGATGSDPVLATLTPGTGISITNGADSITIATTASSGGISSLIADTGSTAGSIIDIAGGNNITTAAAGTVLTVNVSGTAQHALLLGNATGSINSLGVAQNGKIPIGSTGSDPILANITAGTGISVTNGPGSITITSTQTEGVINLDADSGSATGSTIDFAGGNNITTSATGATVIFNVSGTSNHAVQVGNSTNSLTSLAVGNTGQVLIGSTSANPAFGALGFNSGLTANSVVLANGNGAFTALGAATNGQLIIGSTGLSPILSTLTPGSSGNISIVNGPGFITLDLASSPSVSGSLTAGTNLVSSAGTATTPSHTFTGNTTSGMYSAGANQLGFSTGGTSRLTISALGALQAPNLAATVSSASGSVHADILGNLTNFQNMYSSSHYNSTQSLPNAVITAVQFNTDDNNVGSIAHPDVSGGLWTQFAVPAGGAGFYMVSASINWAAPSASSTIETYFQINGLTSTRYGEVLYNSGATGNRTNNTALIYLNVGDYVQLFANQTSGTALNIGSSASSTYNRFQMARLM